MKIAVPTGRGPGPRVLSARLGCRTARRLAHGGIAAVGLRVGEKTPSRVDRPTRMNLNLSESNCGPISLRWKPGRRRQSAAQAEFKFDPTRLRTGPGRSPSRYGPALPGPGGPGPHAARLLASWASEATLVCRPASHHGRLQAAMELPGSAFASRAHHGPGPGSRRRRGALPGSGRCQTEARSCNWPAQAVENLGCHKHRCRRANNGPLN